MRRAAPQPSRGRRPAWLRWLKLAVVSLLGLLLLAFAGLTIYLKSIDFNSYVPDIQDAVLKATGRTLVIDGRIHVGISLHPSLKVEGVHLANPPGFSRANTVNVERMDVAVSLLPLITGTLRVDHITLIHPDILLESRADGSDNWTMAGEGGGAGMSAPSASTADDHVLLPEVHRLMIAHARLGYRDAAGRTHSVEIPKLEMWQKDAADAPMHVQASGEYEALPLKLQGSIGSMHELINNQPIQLDLQAGLAGAGLHISGKVGHPLDGKGLDLGVDFSTPGLGKLAKLVSVPHVLAFPLHAQGRLKDSAGGYELQGVKASVGDNDINGDLSLGLKQAVPVIQAKLDSKRIDITQFLPPQHGKSGAVSATSGGGDGKAASKQRLFSSAPLDLKSLKDMNADVNWKVASMILPQSPLANVDVHVKLDKGVLSVQPLRAQLAGGDIKAGLRLDVGHPVARLEASLQGRKVLLADLLTGADAGVVEKGPLDMQIRLSGSGASIAALMAHLNGHIKIHMGNARVKTKSLNLLGGDLAMTMFNKLNPFSDTPPYTALTCGVVHFRVMDGVMHSDKGIALETDRMNIISSGKINLKDEKIDLGFKTEPREGLGLSLSNMVNVVRLGGTLADPGIRMDVLKTGEAAARTAGAVMTGGLSLLGEGLVNRVTADKTPCKTAMEMK